MRLICPNCGAQYEVPDSVIPETGRDVQCSSCWTTWFQPHAVAAIPEDETQDLDLPDPDWEDTPAQNAPPAPVADEAPAPAVVEEEWQGFPSDPGLQSTPAEGTDLIPDPEDPLTRLPDIADDDYEEDPAKDLPSPRRRLDSSVADMLREEAAREARARAAERRGTLESQPDLGLDAAATPPPAPLPPPPAPETSAPDKTADKQRAREAFAEAMSQPSQTVPPRAAAPRAAPSHPAPPRPAEAQQDEQIASAVADSRRALLPDIEEINSTLRAASDRRPARAADHDTPAQDGQTGSDPAPARMFNRGFSLTILFAILLLALYVFAPTLQDAVPALAPALQSYIVIVNDLRLAVDGQMQNLSRWLSEVAGTTG